MILVRIILALCIYSSSILSLVVLIYLPLKFSDWSLFSHLISSGLIISQCNIFGRDSMLQL